MDAFRTLRISCKNPRFNYFAKGDDLLAKTRRMRQRTTSVTLGAELIREFLNEQLLTWLRERNIVLRKMLEARLSTYYNEYPAATVTKYCECQSPSKNIFENTIRIFDCEIGMEMFEF
ncbi:hypothetical protein WN51_03048 [Melipona quadrifasciata]|uniref:Uncharacterized protein n=1 Tax=Melipona quadrifasciata TaxID=166423 RepID=A0A0M8ZY12_9HYME|nr:hypothetical protein WN51_03048 [Melipona quadrifasciata]